MIVRWFLVTMCYLLASCSQADVRQKHHEAVLDGYKKLPIADSLRKKFGAWSFITHWNMPSDHNYGFKKNEKKWQTLTYIYGRYELIYVQNVILENDGGLISKSIGKPRLLVHEIGKIYEDEVGSRHTRKTDFQITIEGKMLEKLFKSNWDFDSIGVELNKAKPLENIRWKYNYWNRIYPLQIQRY